MALTSLPWETIPLCPGLPSSSLQHEGVRRLSSGVQLWHAIYGIPLQESLDKGLSPVIFLTGGLSHSGFYGYQVAHLSTTRTVIVFDHRGHGRTPLGTDTHLTYDKLEQDLIQLLDSYTIPKAALVGWSDGAMVAWTALRNHHSRVERVFAFGAVDDCEKNDGDRIDELESVKSFFARSQAEWLDFNPGGDAMANFTPYFQLWKREPKWTAETFAGVPVRGKEADAPIVWVAAADHDDWMPNEVSARLRRLIENSTYVEIPNSGHLAFIQVPQIFNGLLSHFLEDGNAAL
jgi:pimeloyl-ACP methyl ester carboxylesterase